MIDFSIGERDQCKGNQCNAGGKDDAEKPITKLVNMFMFNGGTRWPSQHFSLVVGILCPGHWLCLVSSWPSCFPSLVREPEERKKPHSELGSVFMLEFM